MNRVVLLVAVCGLTFASCGDESPDTAPADISQDATTSAALHPIPDDSVAVTGTATCTFGRPDGEADDDAEASDDGETTDDENDADFFVTCELEMSDSRVSGTETHDRFRFVYVEGEDAGVWVVEEAIITNGAGTWRGTAQAVDDGTPMGEARYVGEGDYEGLIFHYYFGELRVGEAQVHGWISGGE